MACTVPPYHKLKVYSCSRTHNYGWQVLGYLRIGIRPKQSDHRECVLDNFLWKFVERWRDVHAH